MLGVAVAVAVAGVERLEDRDNGRGTRAYWTCGCTPGRVRSRVVGLMGSPCCLCIAFEPEKGRDVAGGKTSDAGRCFRCPLLVLLCAPDESEELLPSFLDSDGADTVSALSGSADRPSGGSLSFSSSSSSSSSSTSMPKSRAPFPPTFARGLPFHEARFSMSFELDAGDAPPLPAEVKGSRKVSSEGSSIASTRSVSLPSRALSARDRASSS